VTSDFHVSQVTTTALLLARRSGSTKQVVCHDRYGYLDASNFHRRACTLCYAYLFPSPLPEYVAMMPDYIYLTPMTGIFGANNGTTHDAAKAGSSHNDSSTDSPTLQNNQVGH